MAQNAGSLVVIGKSSTNSFKKFHRLYLCEQCNDNNARKIASTDAPEEDDERDMLNQDAVYRQSHLVNNIKNGRRQGSGRGGKGLKRRRNTVLRSSEKCCPFWFNLKVDSVAFFISLFNGCGSSYHVEHPRFDPEFVPTQLSSLTQEEVDDVMHVNNATVSSAACREFASAKFDRYLPTSQIRYLNSLQDEGICDEYEGVLAAFAESDQIRFNALYSTKENSKDVVITSTKILGEVTNEAALLEGDERECLRPVAESAIEQRKARGLDEEQVFHCIAWTHEKVLRYFLLCPEVVTFDVTSHTNKSGFHLLTFSCRTSVDKQVVFCRVWLPDQRRVSFRYVFQEALPKILPKHVLSRVCFLICDGDAQQNLELRIAAKHLCPNATIGGCSFHMFHNGWNRHVCIVNWNKSRKPAWTAFVRRIHSWMYSWTRPSYCQTQEEYELSKHLFMECLTSKHALKMAGNEFTISSAIAFIKRYVFPNEELFLFHSRKDIFNLCVATTSAHEGTNHGLKSHAAAVKATHALNTAAKAITIQDRAKHAQLDQLVGREFRHKDKSTWSTLPTGNFLLTYAEGLMLHSYRRAKLYKVRRIGQSLFQVVFVGDRCDHAFVARYIDGWPCTEVEESDGDPPTAAMVDVDDQEDKVDDGGEEEDGLFGDQSYCPLFSRAYTVDLNNTCTTCECGHFNRAGYPCPHENACAIAVCEANGTKFEGFGHDSVKVRWWTDFMYWGYRRAECASEEELVKAFHHLAHNDVKGPKFHHTIPATMPIQDPVAPLPATERIKNYSKDSLTSLLRHYKADRFDTLLSSTHLPTGSQEFEDGLDDDEIILPIIDNLRASSDSHFEAMMDDVHEEEMFLHEVEVTRHGSTYRQALYPLFNELTDLLQQANDKEAGEEVEKMMKNSINVLQKTLAEKNTTSPKVTSSSSEKRPWKSITSKEHVGPARVKVAKNSNH